MNLNHNFLKGVFAKSGVDGGIDHGYEIPQRL